MAVVAREVDGVNIPMLLEILVGIWKEGFEIDRSSAKMYARVDFVQDPQGQLLLMEELELIEPSMYLRVDKEAPQRFAMAIDKWLAG